MKLKLYTITTVYYNNSTNYLSFSTRIRTILSKKHLNTYNDQFSCAVQNIASALFWVIQWKMINNLWSYCNILLY